MISNWFPGMPKLNNITKQSAPPPSVDMNAVMKQLLAKIGDKVEEQLGEKVTKDIEELTADISKQQKLEQVLIDTKQQYHNLVSKLDAQTEALKQMLALITDFMTRLCESVENKDMMTPIKDFENGFLNCQVSKVEKQLKYFSKLYDAALSDYLKDRLGSKALQCKEEIQLFKILNKNLETELLKARNDKAEAEKKVLELSSKNSELLERVSIIEKMGSQNLAKLEVKGQQKSKAREEQLLQKVRSLEKQKGKLERNKTSLEGELSKLNSAIQVIKNSQENMIEEMKDQLQKKDLTFSRQISKFSHEKLNLEQKLRFAEEQLDATRAEVAMLKTQQTLLKRQSSAVEKGELEETVKDLQEEVAKLKTTMEGQVSKEMMRILFLGFEDESKEWTVRRDIKNQIYGLIGVNSKKEEAKKDDKKWFGLF